MTGDALLLDRAKHISKDQRCDDYDEDCAEIRCKLTCWMHDPSTGYCPYLLEQAGG